jgi:hypothetical protein
MQGIEIPIGAPLGQLDKDLKGAEKKLKGFTSSAETNLKGFSSTASNAFKSAGLALAGAFSVGAFASFGKEVLAVTAEFEKFGAVLGNTLGSDALAKLKLKEIEEFAAKTPFSVQELTASFVKLANQGFKPTGDEMRRLGDLASSTGKSFDQLAEAILDAQTGEFERLKEFGIRAQDAGDKVIFTFKGVQTTVDKSSEAIRNYVTSLGDAEGVSGSMAVISETLTGKISNLGDSWDQMLVSIGSNTSGVFSSVISIISEAVNSITEFNKELNIASKFKIEGTFIEGLAKSVGKLSGIPALGALLSTKDIKVNAIQSVEKGVNNIVSKTLSGAKSANDFGTAIARLKAEGDKLLQSKGGGDKQVAAAFQSIYQDGIRALQDGRKQFQAELAKPAAASFGKAKKAKTEKNTRDPQFKAESSINELDLFLENYKKTEAQLNKTPLVPFPKLKEKLQVVNQDLINFNQQASDIIRNSIIGTFAGLGSAIGNALANGTSVAEALGQTLLSSVASILGELGKLLIATGVGMISLKAAFKNPATAIAAGVALVALSGFAAAKASKMTSGVGGGGGSSSVGGSVPVPQGSASISTSAAGSAQDFGGGAVVFEISGTNLIGVLNRAGAKLTRFGP